MVKVKLISQMYSVAVLQNMQISRLTGGDQFACVRVCIQSQQTVTLFLPSFHITDNKTSYPSQLSLNIPRRRAAMSINEIQKVNKHTE